MFLILDALRYEPHPTHLHVSAAVQLIEQLRPRRLTSPTCRMIWNMNA